MNLKGILREISQRNKYCKVSLMCESKKKVKFMKTENSTVVARGWGKWGEVD